MGDIHKRLAAVSDTRGRIVAIFVGAVLLPSIALSVLSFNAVPKHAENLKISLLKQSEQLLSFVEQDLETATRRKALEAARAVGPELMLEGRRAQVEAALAGAGLADLQFDSLRLEAWSKTRVPGGPAESGSAEMQLQAVNTEYLVLQVTDKARAAFLDRHALPARRTEGLVDRGLVDRGDADPAPRYRIAGRVGFAAHSLLRAGAS